MIVARSGEAEIIFPTDCMSHQLSMESVSSFLFLHILEHCISTKLISNSLKDLAFAKDDNVTPSFLNSFASCTSYVTYWIGLILIDPFPCGGISFLDNSIQRHFGIILIL